MDVDVLGDADGAVAEEAGHVFDAETGLGQRPGGEDVAEAVERPSPMAIGPSRPADALGGGVQDVAAVIGASRPVPVW